VDDDEIIQNEVVVAGGRLQSLDIWDLRTPTQVVGFYKQRKSHLQRQF
jgi:hypothetical protein